MLGQSSGSQSTKKQHSSSDEFLCIHISRWKQVPIFEDQPWLSNYVLFSWLIFELHAPQSCSWSCSLLSWNVTLHQYQAWFALSVAKTCTAVCYVMHFDKFGCHIVAVQLFLNSFSSSDELQVWIPVQGDCAWNCYIERGCVGKRQVTGDAHHQHQVPALHQCCNDGNVIFGYILLLCDQVLLNSAAGIHQTCLNSASVTQRNHSKLCLKLLQRRWVVGKRQATQEPFNHKLFLAFHQSLCDRNLWLYQWSHDQFLLNHMDVHPKVFLLYSECNPM
jgi:hypothetical protein